MKWFLGLALASLVVLPVVSGGEADGDKLQKLTEQIEALTKRVGTLEKENKDLKNNQKGVKLDQQIQEAISAKVVEEVKASNSGSGFVHKPDQQAGLSVSFRSLWLEPSVDNLDFVVVSPGPSGGTQDRRHGDVKQIEPDYAFAFEVGAKYTWENGSDVGIEWMHLHDDWGKLVVDTPETFLQATRLSTNAIIDDDDSTSARADYDLRLDSLGAEFGQTMGVGDRFQFRLSGGLSYLDLEQNFLIHYTQQVTPELSRNDWVDYKSRFSGIGPKIGLNGSWRIGYGFKLFSGIDGSLYLGEWENSFRESDLQAGGVNGTVRANRRQLNDAHIVPAIRLKGGVSWERKITDLLGIQVEGGFEMQRYFDAMRQSHVVDDVDAQLTADETTNLDLSGPFFRIGLSFKF